MVQRCDPSLAVLATMVLLNSPPLKSSILTFAPAFEEVHIILLVVPTCQLSPPLGCVTVIVRTIGVTFTVSSSITTVLLDVVYSSSPPLPTPPPHHHPPAHRRA